MAELVPHKQRRFALDVVERLREAGFEAYWAGGCVRDHLLGRVPNDYDVATSARPEEARRVFQKWKTLEIGAAFGVVAVIGPKEAGTVEIATFRRDAAYVDGRHPSSVSYSTPEEDAARRDFTINGLFYDPISDQVLDFVGGQVDLKRRVVRAIGSPTERFAEDKLRLLRAVRMAATFGFHLDEATRAAVTEMAHEVTVVSAERIAQEMRLLLVLEGRRRAVELLRETRLLAASLPEVDQSHQCESAAGANRWRSTLKVLERLDSPNFPLALAALLHATGVAGENSSAVAAAASNVRAVARRWRLSKKEERHAAWLVEHQDDLLDVMTKPWSETQPILISEHARDLVTLFAAKGAAAGRAMPEVEHCLTLLEWPREALDPPPLITGEDLAVFNLPRGPLFAEILAKVRSAQLDGKVEDRAAALRLTGDLAANAQQVEE